MKNRNPDGRPVGDADQSLPRERGGIKDDQNAPSNESTPLGQAEMRTEQANLRTDQANTRTEQANARTAEANTRTEQADLRTEKATTTGDALRASELSYRRLFESARDGILILNADTGHITDANPFLIELLGYSHDEMVGKSVGELSPFRDILSNQAMLERLQKDGYIRYEDLPLETRDGRHISVEFVSNVYQAGDDKVIQCNIRDITERKQAEVVLQASQSVIKGIMDAIPVRVFWKDLNLVYLGCNAVFARDAGLGDPSEVIGKDDFQLVWKAQAQAFRDDDLSVIESGCSKLLIEKEQTTPDGKIITLLTNKLPLRNASRGVVGVIGAYMDITERKQVEESNVLLATAVEQAAETIVITDTEGKITYVNPAFEQSTGYTSAEVLGNNPRILKSGKQEAAFYRQMWDVLQRGEVWHGHFRNKRKDGTLYEEEATISPVRDAAGKVINYVAVKHDVTREMQLESQFRQSQKMEAIGTLAGGVAHDFNNILAVIQMQAELLKSSGDLSAGQAELADDIGNVVQRAVSLTRQLLVFSRKEVLQPRDMDLNQNVTEMAKMLTRLLGENIVVQLKLAAQPMLLHADAGLMDQVLMNLAVNARDAMPEGGQLVIETSGVEFDESSATQTALARPGSFVRLSLSDNGCGIPPENLSRIFEPYFTTKSIGKGTGLGLATVFGIVQQHHGWINVYSEVGHGTTFKVDLPRLLESHDTNVSEKVPTIVQTGHETILLVEDEPALRATIKLTLAQLGYSVLEAATGFKALEVWEEHHDEIHLLLTDLMMPDGMTGKELGERLLQENPKIKVIYMSGYSADIVAKDFPLQEGVNFLIKPFRVQQLAETIRHSIGERANVISDRT